MRLCRLFLFMAAFIGLTAPAQAQYTSRSSGSAGTAAVPQAPARPAPAQQPQPARQAAPAPASANTFTTTGQAAQTQAAPAAAQAAAPAAAPAAQTAPRFRPRPTAPVQTSAEGEDDLPSFSAFEQNTSSAASGTPAAQAQPGQPAEAAANLPPPEPPKGEIWLYITDFTYSDVNGMFMNCNWKLVLQNRTNTPIETMRLTYTLLGETSPIFYNNVKPNASVVEVRGVYSDKCPAMANIKPTVEVVSCRLGTITGKDCSGYIKIK